MVDSSIVAPNTLSEAIRANKMSQPVRVLVTGGGTIAPIDDVRVITNVSTGRFAAAITEALLDRGARVWHVATPTARAPAETHGPAAPPKLNLRVLRRGTVAEYAQEIHYVLTSEQIDITILAAAVSDYEPIPVAGKIASDRDELVIRCRPAPKVIKMVKGWAPTTFLVGFKMLSGASDDSLISAARESLEHNGADLVVANDLRVVHTSEHRIHLIQPDGPVETIGPGVDIAGRLAERILALASRRAGS